MKSNKIVKDLTKKKITNIEELKIFTMQIGMFYNVYNVELINMFSKKFNRSFVSRWQEVERRGEERRDGQFDVQTVGADAQGREGDSCCKF